MEDPRGQRRPDIHVLLFGVFGFVFLGVGVTTIVSLWMAPFGAFGSPPIFFRIIGSFIATAFVAIGGTQLFAAIKAHRSPAPPDIGLSEDPPSNPQVGYTCSKCGAALGDDADVSPHGDVKCTYCSNWFNIHKR